MLCLGNAPLMGPAPQADASHVSHHITPSHCRSASLVLASSSPNTEQRRQGALRTHAAGEQVAAARGPVRDKVGTAGAAVGTVTSVPHQASPQCPRSCVCSGVWAALSHNAKLIGQAKRPVPGARLGNPDLGAEWALTQLFNVESRVDVWTCCLNGMSRVLTTLE